MITFILVLLIFGLVLVFAVTREGRPSNYPPGPSWFPFVGNGSLLRKLCKELKGQHKVFDKLAKDYNSPVIGLKLGRDLIVVGVTADAVKAILTRDVFTGRPLSFFMKLRCFGKRLGITSTDGDKWKEQRNFTVRHLKQFGYGKGVMETMILEEVNDLIQFLKEEKEVKNLGGTISPSVLNVLWAIGTGKRIEKANPRLKTLLNLLSRRSRAFDMCGGILNQMPWLRYIAPKKTGYSLLQQLNSQLKLFLMETIEEQKKSYSRENTRNLIDAFLHEQNSNNNNNSNYTDDELVVLLLDLFLGGAQTTSQTLDFAFLLMLKYPEIQEKVHHCIIENVGKERLPTLEDKPMLVYVEAVLLEVMRLFCVVPVIGPRRSLQDTTLDGYFVPKNSTVLANVYTVHHDEKIFPNPNEFRPERFINSKGELTNQESVWAFGLGKRRCLGEALAKSSLFLIFSGIMQNFQITKISDKDEPSLEPLVGITIAPQPYSAKFCWR